MPGTRIRYRRSEAPPPFLYAITLELIGEEGGKQPPQVLEFDSPNDAMAAALDKAKRNAGEIVRQWRAS